MLDHNELKEIAEMRNEDVCYVSLFLIRARDHSARKETEGGKRSGTYQAGHEE